MIRSFYKREEWLRLRHDILNESDGKCLICGRGGSDGVVLHVDHIKPKSIYPELALEKSNLQVLCKDCNLGKSNRSDRDWRNKNERSKKMQSETAGQQNVVVSAVDNTLYDLKDHLADSIACMVIFTEECQKIASENMCVFTLEKCPVDVTKKYWPIEKNGNRESVVDLSELFTDMFKVLAFESEPVTTASLIGSFYGTLEGHVLSKIEEYRSKGIDLGCSPRIYECTLKILSEINEQNGATQ